MFDTFSAPKALAPYLASNSDRSIGEVARQNLAANKGDRDLKYAIKGARSLPRDVASVSANSEEGRSIVKSLLLNPEWLPRLDVSVSHLVGQEHFDAFFQKASSDQKELSAAISKDVALAKPVVELAQKWLSEDTQTLNKLAEFAGEKGLQPDQPLDEHLLHAFAATLKGSNLTAFYRLKTRYKTAALAKSKSEPNSVAAENEQPENGGAPIATAAEELNAAHQESQAAENGWTYSDAQKMRDEVLAHNAQLHEQAEALMGRSDKPQPGELPTAEEREAATARAAELAKFVASPVEPPTLAKLQEVLTGAKVQLATDANRSLDPEADAANLRLKNESLGMEQFKLAQRSYAGFLWDRCCPPHIRTMLGSGANFIGMATMIISTPLIFLSFQQWAQSMKSSSAQQQQSAAAAPAYASQGSGAPQMQATA